MSTHIWDAQLNKASGWFSGLCLGKYSREEMLTKNNNVRRLDNPSINRSEYKVVHSHSVCRRLQLEKWFLPQPQMFPVLINMTSLKKVSCLSSNLPKTKMGLYPLCFFSFSGSCCSYQNDGEERILMVKMPGACELENYIEFPSC